MHLLRRGWRRLVLLVVFVMPSIYVSQGDLSTLIALRNMRLTNRHAIRIVARVRLYRTTALPTSWIGEDELGALVSWPRERLGWLRRTPYSGRRSDLEEVPPALARGTRWPGAGSGRPPRTDGAASKNVTIRASDAERAAWEQAAGNLALATWAQRELNAAARRARKRSR